MCTAISDNTYGHLFGRTLDVVSDYSQGFVCAERNSRLSFLRAESIDTHPFVMGVGLVRERFPLFFDAQNEHGLASAGLNFPESACYNKPRNNKINLASFEVIPYVLAKCKSVKEAKALFLCVNVTDDAFSSSLSSTPLHWIFADIDECITVEPTSEGLCVYDNPTGVLTNEPPFPRQVSEYENYVVSARDAFYTRARFARAVYVKNHTGIIGEDRIGRFFAMTDTLKVPYGCASSQTGERMYTAYTSCADNEKHAYYVREYTSPAVKRFSADDFDVDGDVIVFAELDKCKL